MDCRGTGDGTGVTGRQGKRRMAEEDEKRIRKRKKGKEERWCGGKEKVGKKIRS